MVISWYIRRQKFSTRMFYPHLLRGYFLIVKRWDQQQHGEYRTRWLILEIYDEMARAVRTGQNYQTRLEPPPADPRVAHERIEQDPAMTKTFRI
jgi:hypothetical protein